MIHIDLSFRPIRNYIDAKRSIRNYIFYMEVI
nr:MAG TPA: hypothetical protein [Bacteriophage sp.]